MPPDKDAVTSKSNIGAPPHPIWPVIALGVLGLGGIGLGIGFAVARGQANDAYMTDDAKIRKSAIAYGYLPNGAGVCRSPPIAEPAHSDFVKACSSLTNSQNNVNTDNAVAITGFIVGGAAIVAGVIYYLVGPGKNPKPTTAYVTPWLGLGTTGMSLSAAF